MEVEVVGTDPFGDQAYVQLFSDIMNDLDKAVMIDRAKLVLDPATPLFVFSLVLKAEPAPKSIADVATVREENGNVHLTITQERYAPEILRALWARYGRKDVVQQTRFDLDVNGASESDMAGLLVSNGEDDRREIMAAIWRTMPEGIKNRKSLVSGSVITVVATEEVLLPEMISKGEEVHRSMGGAIDV